MRKVGIDKSGQWIGEAFGILRAHPVPFLLMGLFYTLVPQLPLLGFLIMLLLGPALLGGIVFAAEQASRGKPVSFGQLFKAFQDGDRIGSYMALCLPFIGLFVIMIALLFPAFPAISSALHGHVSASGPADARVKQMMDALSPLVSRHVGALFLWLLVYLVLVIVASMLTFLAPARIMFARDTAFVAMRESFKACRMNFGAFFLLAVLLFMIFVGFMLLVSLLGLVIPHVLATLLALAPYNAVVALVVYAMHRSIFDDQANAHEPPGPGNGSPTGETHTLQA